MFKWNRVLLSGLAVANILMFCFNASAASAYINNAGMNNVSVQSVNILRTETNLIIEKSGSANVVAKVYGKAGTQKIEMSVYLQRYDTSTKKWKIYKTWGIRKNASALLFNENYLLNAKGTYRCKCNATIIKDSVIETIEFNSEKKKYS